VYKRRRRRPKKANRVDAEKAAQLTMPTKGVDDASEWSQGDILDDTTGGAAAGRHDLDTSKGPRVKCIVCDKKHAGQYLFKDKAAAQAHAAEQKGQKKAKEAANPPKILKGKDREVVQADKSGPEKSASSGKNTSNDDEEPTGPSKRQRQRALSTNVPGS